jgi:hypothetical protein
MNEVKRRNGGETKSPQWAMMPALEGKTMVYVMLVLCLIFVSTRWGRKIALCFSTSVLLSLSRVVVALGRHAILVSSLLLTRVCCLAAPPIPRISTARGHLVEVTDEIGKAEVAEQEDALDRTRQAAIYERDASSQGEETALDANNSEEGGGGGSSDDESGGDGNEDAAGAGAAGGGGGNEGSGEEAREQPEEAAPAEAATEEEGQDSEGSATQGGDPTPEPDAAASSAPEEVNTEPEPEPAPKGPPVKKHKGLRAVIVGNGPSVIAKGKKVKPYGALIDSYDHVYRFNLFKTKGYEKHAVGGCVQVERSGPMSFESACSTLNL